MNTLKHKEEQIKIHKWWIANKDKIRNRVINSFNLPETFKL